nr:unnamed protein product [Spirometra erinaceieuropaei]
MAILRGECGAVQEQEQEEEEEEEEGEVEGMLQLLCTSQVKYEQKHLPGLPVIFSPAKDDPLSVSYAAMQKAQP